jgi:hypothetical protein
VAITRANGPSIISSGGSFTASTGSDRLLVAILHGHSTLVGGATAVSCDFGGVGMTLIAEEHASSYVGTGIFYLKDADILSGAQTVTPAWASVPNQSGRVTLLTLEGVDQTTVYDDFAEHAAASSQPGALVLDTNSSGGYGLAAYTNLSSGSTFSNWGTGWTEVWEATNSSTMRTALGEALNLDGTSVTAQPTCSSSPSIAGVAVAFKAAGGSTTRGAPFGSTAFNGGRVFFGPIN